MAMTTPIGEYKSAFDKNTTNIDDITFKFKSSGGNVVVGNILTVYDFGTNVPVFQIQTQNFRFESILQEEELDLLENGKQYTYTFKTIGVNDEESEESNPIAFWCYESPTITFTNVDPIIDNTVYDFNVEITTGQKENLTQYELVQSVQFNLCDEIGNIIETSGIIYIKDNGETPIDDGARPLEVSWTFGEFENDTNYMVECIIETENKTIVSEFVNFKVLYVQPKIYDRLELTNHCDEGYINIQSKIKSIDGTSFPSVLEYPSGNSVYLINNGYYVKWDREFTIPTDFLLRLRASLARVNERFCLLGDEDSGNYFELKLVREKLGEELNPIIYFVMLGYENNVLKVIQKSTTISGNPIENFNNFDDLFIWVKKVGNDYELILNRMSEPLPQTIFKWDNASSNVVYERNSDLVYLDSYIAEPTPYPDIKAEDVSNIFPITNVVITNGIYSLIDITENIDEEFNVLNPQWSYDTILNCNFNNNINGGSIEQSGLTIDRVLVQRRLGSTIGSYTTIADIFIDGDISKLEFSIRDYCVPSGKKIEYSIVPISMSELGGERIVGIIESKFNGVFITDRNKSFKLYNGFAYSSGTRNIQRGIYNTLGSKYPIIVQNGETNYFSGGISGRFMGQNYLNTRVIDKNSVVEQTNDFLDFLADNTAKIITDWNGNVWIARISDNPNVNFDNSNLGFVDISFSFVEQGKWNNSEDLFNNGLVI